MSHAVKRLPQFQTIKTYKYLYIIRARVCVCARALCQYIIICTYIYISMAASGRRDSHSDGNIMRGADFTTDDSSN